ncbi:MAG: hypothetical protein HYV09_31655 [Deltaproteobacteria bacterium]|nr:hypothetical protein [Deltaproteobacteria bacterium]
MGSSLPGMLGAHSDTLLLIHLIWWTSERQPVFGPADDVWLADSVAAEALSCDLLAVGAWVDHVHAPRPFRAQREEPAKQAYEAFGAPGFIPGGFRETP